VKVLRIGERPPDTIADIEAVARQGQRIVHPDLACQPKELAPRHQSSDPPVLSNH